MLKATAEVAVTGHPLRHKAGSGRHCSTARDRGDPTHPAGQMRVGVPNGVLLTLFPSRAKNMSIIGAVQIEYYVRFAKACRSIL
jgi:hypothetical protein